MDHADDNLSPNKLSVEFRANSPPLVTKRSLTRGGCSLSKTSDFRKIPKTPQNAVCLPYCWYIFMFLTPETIVLAIVFHFSAPAAHFSSEKYKAFSKNNQKLPSKKGISPHPPDWRKNTLLMNFQNFASRKIPYLYPMTLQTAFLKRSPPALQHSAA